MNLKEEVANFTTPKLVKASNAWYIEFSFLNPANDKMKRFRITENLNRTSVSPTLQVKKQNFNELLTSVTEQLNNGWNPFRKMQIEKKQPRITLKESKPIYIELIKDLRIKTRVKYLSVLNRIIKTLGEDVKVDDISFEDIVQLMKELEAKSRTGSWRNGTFNSVRVEVFNFFAVMKRHKYCKENPVSGIRMKKKQITQNHQVFSDEDFKTIIQHLDFISPQTSLFCRMIYYTCIRPNEIRQLRVKHVNLDTRVIIVPDYISKNKEEGYVHIDEELLKHLKNLELNKYSKEDYLFTSLYKKFVGAKQMGVNTIYRRLMFALDDLGLNDKDYTLYSFKHFSNVKKYLAGWSIAEICSANRHKSLVETETYLKALLKFAPIGKAVPIIA